MTSTLQQTNRRRLRWLCMGLVLYFCVMLYGEQYVRTVPYQVVVVAAVLNMAVILTFVFSIRKAYLGMRSSAPLEGSAPTGTGSRIPEDNRRRLIGHWIGAGFCTVAFVKGLAYIIAYAGRAPLKILIAAEIFSGAMLATFLLAIAKIYKKRRSGESSPP